MYPEKHEQYRQAAEEGDRLAMIFVAVIAIVLVGFGYLLGRWLS